MDDAQYTGLELMHFADHAMYQAKRAGGNSLVLSTMDADTESSAQSFAVL